MPPYEYVVFEVITAVTEDYHFLGHSVLVACFILAYVSILNMEAMFSSEESDGFHRTLRRYIPQDGTFLVTVTRVHPIVQCRTVQPSVTKIKSLLRLLQHRDIKT
jgi:hypothetical protein